MKDGMCNPRLEFSSALYARVGAFVLTFSVLLVCEGISRCNIHIGTPHSLWSGNKVLYPPVMELIAAVCLTFYGLIGIAVGLTAVVFKAGNAVVTASYLAITFVFGWFFFCVTLGKFPFDVDRAPVNLPGLNFAQSGGLKMLGMLGTFGLGTPLLGSHFFVVLHLLRIQQGKASKYTPGYYKPRVFFYGFLMICKGIAELAVGSILHRNIGSQRYLPPYVTLPFVVSYSQISIAVGLVVTLLGIACFVISIANLRRLVVPYAIVSFFVVILQLACSDLTQIGLLSAFPSPPIFVGTIVAWNTIIMTLMPVYFLAYAHVMPSEVDVNATEERVDRKDARVYP